ncbi:MAG TPA: nucleotidyltransferase domain-containing protein [Candidatus Paceibacterota bacterium]|nr:nucleotidyltransferase domain-containing protein [Candidatus Paceibacterota bacterium]
MDFIPTLIEREAILDQIANELKKRLGRNIISAIAYGSALCEDFMLLSDYDVLLVLDDAGIDYLNMVRDVKHFFTSRGVVIDLNVHSMAEMPQYRANAFWHNNRSHYMRLELDIYGKVLIGKNLFHADSIPPAELELEGVRVISSLVYQARKILINRPLNSEERIRMMKFCIYAVLYALAMHQYFPKTKMAAMKNFHDIYPDLQDPSFFLETKVSASGDISDEVIYNAYGFLLKLDQHIFELYSKNYETH